MNTKGEIQAKELHKQALIVDLEEVDRTVKIAEAELRKKQNRKSTSPRLHANGSLSETETSHSFRNSSIQSAEPCTTDSCGYRKGLHSQRQDLRTTPHFKARRQTHRFAKHWQELDDLKVELRKMRKRRKYYDKQLRSTMASG